MILVERNELLHDAKVRRLQEGCSLMLSGFQEEEVGVLASFQGFVLEGGQILCGAYIEEGAEDGLPRVLVGMLKKYLEGGRRGQDDTFAREVAIRELDVLLQKLRLIDLKPGSAALT
jgi:hypothetical protein